ncbi:hypothetical protein AAIB33_07440 [Microbacterium sp. AZCO]
MQIVAGVIHDATGYSPQSSSAVGKIIEAVVNIGHIWFRCARDF